MLEEECYLVWENVVGYHCVDWCSYLCYALFSIVSDCLSLWFLSVIINVGMWWCGILKDNKVCGNKCLGGVGFAWKV